MGTVVHLLRKDVRRFRVWLAAWGAALLPLIPATTGGLGFILTNAAPVLALILFVVLTALVVQEDLLVGSTAFWFTRPIAGRDLLVSKLLYVALFLVLPASVVDVMRVAIAGVGPRLVMLAVPEIILEWTLWATCVLALASLTASLTGLLGAALKTVVLVAIARIVFAAIYLIYRDGWDLLGSMTFGGWLASILFSPFDPWKDTPSWAASRLIGVSSATIASGLLVAWWLYTRRQLRTAWGLVAAGVACTVFLWGFWRWDLVGPRQSATTTADLRTMESGVQVSLAPTARADTSTFAGQKASPQKEIRGRLTIRGVPSPYVPELRGLRGTLSFADRRFTVAGGQNPGFDVSWNPLAVEELLGGARLVNLEQENATTVPILEMPVDQYRAHLSVPGRFEARASVRVRRYRVVAELPVVVDHQYQAGSERAVISAVRAEHGDCMVMITATQVSLLLAPHEHLNRRILFIRYNPDVLYVLRNRRRHEAFWPAMAGSFGFGWFSRSYIDEAIFGVNFRSTVPGGPPLPAIDDAWLEDADLVRIEAGFDDGGFEKELRVDEFVIEGEAAS